jgi:ribosome-associated protein
MAVVNTPNGIAIPESAIRFTFVRSGGPGGQHVNTSSTKVQVQVGIEACGLSAKRTQRLRDVFGSVVTASSSSSRSQWKNREEALLRVLTSIDTALTQEKPRVATKATRGAQERRLKNKARQSRRKFDRRWNDNDG